MVEIGEGQEQDRRDETGFCSDEGRRGKSVKKTAADASDSSGENVGARGALYRLDRTLVNLRKPPDFDSGESMV